MFKLRKRFSQFKFPYLTRILFFIIIFSGIWLMFTLSLSFQQPASNYVQSKLSHYLSLPFQIAANGAHDSR